MQQCSKEMAGITGDGGGQIGLQDLQNGHDDFFDQMLSSLPSSWPDLATAAAAAAGITGDDPSTVFDESSMLATRLRQNQISNRRDGGAAKSTTSLLLQQQQMLMSAIGRTSPGSLAAGAGGDSGLLPLPLSLSNAGAPSRDDGGEGMFTGFGGSLQRERGANQPHFPHSQGAAGIPQQNFGVAQPPAAATNQAPPPANQAGGGAGGTGAAAAPPRQRVRARRGQATDPHSIAERLRRERIAERMKALQELVPNANKTDKASMLDEIIDYVKFLQLQVKVLSMSRLGGAAAVAPLVADMSSEGGSGLGRGSGGGSSSGGGGDSMTVTEHQVAKLMEEDMGSAMQYLQGKGLCLMPISLASAISTATCHPRAAPPTIGHPNPGLIPALPPTNTAGVENPSSPSMSVLTVQSAMANGAAAGESSSAKDATSVSKP